MLHHLPSRNASGESIPDHIDAGFNQADNHLLARIGDLLFEEQHRQAVHLLLWLVVRLLWPGYMRAAVERAGDAAVAPRPQQAARATSTHEHTRRG